MKHLFKWYFNDWIKIIFRPIYFYTFMEKGAWSDKSFTFLLISSWILAAGSAAAAFSIVLFPMLSTLIVGLSGIKFLIALPIFALLSLMFFVMILLIAGAGVVVFALAAFAAVSAILHCVVARFGGEGRLDEMVKASYYSSAVLLAAILIPLLACLTKYKLFTLHNFIIGFNIIAYMIIIYWWGLWSIATRKVYKVSRLKAVLASLTVIILVVLLQVFVGLKIIPRLERWIS